MAKQKQKTHKGVAKRVKLTARGKIKHRRAGKGHLMSVKSANRLRGMRKAATVTNKAFTKKMVAALHS
jgi:large subunit ribosomal protein L35